MKTKFQITNLPSIEPLKPYKETAKMYYFEGYKLPKTAVHDTYEEARAELLSQCEKQIEFYQHCLQSEVSKLKKIIDL